VIPMGQISSSGEIKKWSTHFGQQNPLLLFASDLDVACTHCETQSERNHLVVVDTSGTNAKRLASLKRLQHFSVPTLVVAEERSVGDIGLEGDKQTATWEWNLEDLSALLWSSQSSPGQQVTGPISLFESRMSSHLGQQPIIHVLAMPAAGTAFNSLRR